MADLSIVFQLVLISVRIVSIYAEEDRGCIVLSATLCRIVILLGYVLQSLVEIMDYSLSAELTYEGFLFDVLKQNVDTMNTIETQLLSGKVSRFLNVKLVKEMETTMKQLELRVVTATNTSKTSVHREKVTFNESKTSVLREKSQV